MDPLVEDNNAEAPSLNLLGQAAARLLEYGNNASNNLQETFTKMTLQGWIRLTVIVGGYLLLRPYILKLSVKTAVSKMEEEDERERAKAAAMTPNELRGAKQQLEEHLEDDNGEGTGADWGQKARVRQRTMLKEMLEAEEQRRMEEEEDDKDIAEFLED
ncbi:hypothetical protein ISF_03907 [Cordyceps fumosorosea ARSEF 2679]|uniref:Protein trafficking Pga2 n=1 Tax=Cordyceps fumosorosea (strain ARSEF 2679) TaxID=1081104 RepID=A0A167YAJ3_CORFA|nr:hypothetical protein ISF_03907 [Cordyceps fumosorosea ARSEF 2679]OAA66069.1 hypothetical protein ISF_03907 [Cordyceps fumosorosea ARSEF 2679]